MSARDLTRNQQSATAFTDRQKSYINIARQNACMVLSSSRKLIIVDLLLTTDGFVMQQYLMKSYHTHNVH